MKKRIYVIQKHDSTRLHFDLRLEKDNVLKSWAVTKEPSDTVKRLAVETTNHLKSYAKFEGEIKEGYGKGKVKIWDKGNYTLIKKTPKEIEFSLQGKQLHGKYVLVNAKMGGDKKNWLFFRVD